MRVPRHSSYTAFFSTPDGCLVQPLGYGIKAFELGSAGRLVPVVVSPQPPVHLSAYGAISADNHLFVTLVNKEHGANARDLAVTLIADKDCANGQAISLAAPNEGVAARTGVTLGGMPIKADGSWSGTWAPVARSADGSIRLNVAPASAVVLKFGLFFSFAADSGGNGEEKRNVFGKSWKRQPPPGFED